MEIKIDSSRTPTKPVKVEKSYSLIASLRVFLLCSLAGCASTGKISPTIRLSEARPERFSTMWNQTSEGNQLHRTDDGYYVACGKAETGSEPALRDHLAFMIKVAECNEKWIEMGNGTMEPGEHHAIIPAYSFHIDEYASEESLVPPHIVKTCVHAETKCVPIGPELARTIDDRFDSRVNEDEKQQFEAMINKIHTLNQNAKLGETEKGK